MASKSVLIFTIIACTLLQSISAYPLDEEDQYDAPSYVYVQQEPEQLIYHQRYARSLQPGAPNFPMPGQKNQDGWKFDPALTRDENGNTRGSVNVQHTGPNHEVSANWDKVVRGPNRAKPSYSIHGSWRF